MARSSRKQEILQAALACFTEFGVEATTIEMIRDRSGASIGSPITTSAIASGSSPRCIWRALASTPRCSRPG